MVKTDHILVKSSTYLLLGYLRKDNVKKKKRDETDERKTHLLSRTRPFYSPFSFMITTHMFKNNGFLDKTV